MPSKYLKYYTTVASLYSPMLDSLADKPITRLFVANDPFTVYMESTDGNIDTSLMLHLVMKNYIGWGMPTHPSLPTPTP